MIWFVAQTVELCRQQHAVIVSNIPAVSSIMISGEDGSDHWRSQQLWDVALGHKIIVSTPAILRDVLNRAFLLLSRISLLVFDEGMLDMFTNTDDRD
jgi:superfamily II DNA/RNA helicase